MTNKMIADLVVTIAMRSGESEADARYRLWSILDAHRGEDIEKFEIQQSFVVDEVTTD